MKPNKILIEDETSEFSPIKKGFKSYPRSTPPLDSEEGRQKTQHEHVKVVEFEEYLPEDDPEGVIPKSNKWVFSRPQ